MSTQVYVLPIRSGWAVITYGDPICPDDEIVPLPLTSLCTYDDAVTFVGRLPMAQGALVDGWAALEDLRECEPELAGRLA